jgi:NAD(P)-dependent dehydrogenase (short-subunit alcohol dehydrogenase family)
MLNKLADATPAGRPEARQTRLQAFAESYPLRRIATAQEIAEAAVWVCTHATFMTGHTLVLDGGGGCSFNLKG